MTPPNCEHGVAEQSSSTKPPQPFKTAVPLAALARCAREIAAIEAQLREGAGDVEGLLQGLQDWNYEKRMILEESR